jgi:hypothetical protein
MALFVPAAAIAYTAIGGRVILATVVLPQATPNEALDMTPSIGPVLGGDFTNLTAWDLAPGRLRHCRLGCRSAGRGPIDHGDEKTGLPMLLGKR